MIEPDVGLKKRGNKLTKVDLPLPDGPTKATTSPAGIFKSIPLSTSFLTSLESSAPKALKPEYPKPTCLNSRSPRALSNFTALALRDESSSIG